MRSLRRSLKALWQLLRLEHGIMYGIGVLIGIFLGGGADFKNISLGFLTAVFLQASAFALNDYFDYYVDMANRRFDRPLVRGELSRNTALFLSLLLFPIGIVFASLISPIAFLFATLVTILGFAYDYKLKELGFLGNIYIAFTMAAPFIFGGLIAELRGSILLLSLIAFFCGVGREVMKGIEDVEGDAIRNVKTIARVHGVEKAVRISSIFFLIAVLLSFAPPLVIAEYLDLKYIVPVAITDFLLLKVILELQKSKNVSKDVAKFRKRTLFAMLLGLIGFLAGAF
ncbi:MAG: UbiA family prenyltransferase [Archaeoglobaceae archaeon]